ncbi:hypothetical protein [Angustibacter aerolatus]
MVAAVVGALLLVVAAAVLAPRALRPHDTRPVVLPDVLAGYPVISGAGDFSAERGPTSWREAVRDDAGGNAYDGRAYGQATLPMRRLHAMVVRTDATGAFDLHLTAEPISHVGDVSCTQTLRFPALGHPGTPGPPALHPGKALCWRTSEHLSVVVFALIVPEGDPLERAATAVDDLWALQH